MTDLSLLHAFGSVVRTRRRALDMTQGDLATVALVDRSFIARIEAGKHQPSLSVIFGLACGLTMTPPELLEETQRVLSEGLPTRKFIPKK
jgi:transcriptional regulator with XRE-family HTH domain